MSDDLDALAATPGAFAQAFDLLGAARFRARPQPDEWSPFEVLVHVRAADAVISPRVVQVLARPGVALADLDERRVGALLTRVDAEPADSIAAFRSTRRELVALVRSLTDDERRQQGMHETRGLMTVDELCGMLVDHEREHVEQLDAAVAVLAT